MELNSFTWHGAALEGEPVQGRVALAFSFRLTPAGRRLAGPFGINHRHCHAIVRDVGGRYYHITAYWFLRFTVYHSRGLWLLVNLGRGSLPLRGLRVEPTLAHRI